MARWVLDKLWYWLAWSAIFALLMFALTSALDGGRGVITACSFFAFWGTNFTMDYLRERVFRRVTRGIH